MTSWVQNSGGVKKQREMGIFMHAVAVYGAWGLQWRGCSVWGVEVRGCPCALARLPGGGGGGGDGQDHWGRGGCNRATDRLHRLRIVAPQGGRTIVGDSQVGQKHSCNSSPWAFFVVTVTVCAPVGWLLHHQRQ